jgi:nitrogen fixation protein
MQIIDANGNMFGYDHLEIIGIDGKPKTTGGGGGGPYVPYTGATGNVDLGEYELKAGQFTLDTSPTGTAVVGTTQWNNTIGSSQTTLKGGTVILKNGVDLVARVVNKVTPNATLTRANYTAVRVSGAQGQRLAVAYAQANNDNNSADTIGLVIETIATNQEGFIMTVGQLDEVNTTGSLQGETWADGDVLYLSPTTAGLLTNIKPTGLTGHIVVMGYVEYAHAVHGSIYVKIMNGWELDELHNVYINPATLANNDLLQYDSASSLWKNESLSNAGVQPTLVSGTNIKTVNSTSLLGSGDIAVQPTLVSGTNIKTINGNSVLGSGDLTISGGGGIHVIVKPQTGNQVSTLTASTNSGFNVGAMGFRMQAFPFYPASSFTCSSLTLNVTTLIAGGIARILIYSDVNGKPSVKLYESANLDCSTTGLKTASTTFNFVAGTKYWITVQSNNASIAFTLQPQNFSTVVSTFGLATRYTSYILNSIAIGSAPATWTGGTLHAFEFPFVYITSA